MNNAETFLKPGQIALNFLLSLFEVHPETMDTGFYTLLSGLIAILIWSWVIRLCFEIIKKAFGFDSRRRF